MLHFQSTLKEVLREHSVILWMDASIRHLNNGLLGLTQELRDSMGVLLLIPTITTVFQVTNPQFYEFVPTDIAKIKKIRMYAATTMLFANTKSVYENILKWAYACSSEKACIDPPGANRLCGCQRSPTKCSFNAFSGWLKCHRFDQAMINILLLNWYRFNVKGFLGPMDLLRIYRDVEPNQTLRMCVEGQAFNPY